MFLDLQSSEKQNYVFSVSILDFNLSLKFDVSLSAITFSFFFLVKFS